MPGTGGGGGAARTVSLCPPAQQPHSRGGRPEMAVTFSSWGLPSLPLALLSLPRPAPCALPLPGPLLSGRTVSNKLLHPQVCPPSGRRGLRCRAGRGGGRAPLRAPLSRGRPAWGERAPRRGRHPELRWSRGPAGPRRSARPGAPERPSGRGPGSQALGGARPGRGRGPEGGGASRPAPGPEALPRPRPCPHSPSRPGRPRGNPGPRPSCLSRLRELRQPSQRADRHPGHERLPDRHEEAQGAAEEAQRRQSPVLSAGGSVPRGRPGLAQVTAVGRGSGTGAGEGTPDGPAASSGLRGLDPRLCLGPAAPGSTCSPPGAYGAGAELWSSRQEGAWPFPGLGAGRSRREGIVLRRWVSPRSVASRSALTILFAGKPWGEQVANSGLGKFGRGRDSMGEAPSPGTFPQTPWLSSPQPFSLEGWWP